jgi:hypothetical protein
MLKQRGVKEKEMRIECEKDRKSKEIIFKFAVCAMEAMESPLYVEKRNYYNHFQY